MMQPEMWKILLVEDDEDDYLLTRAALQTAIGSRFEMVWAQTYDEALAELETGIFDVALVDHRLGECTGLDLIRTGIAKPTAPPFILLTGEGNRALDLEASQAGAVDFLEKTEVSPVLLERTIRYAIARARSEKQISLKADQIEMQHRLIQQREEERLNIARELHDGPLQELIGMQFMLSETQGALGEPQSVPEVVQDKVTKVQSALQQQIYSLRTFCSDLRPPALAPFGLKPAIQAHADQFHEKYPDLRLILDLDQDRQRLPEPTRLAFFRIYQELLNNIIRHAQATQAVVRLRVGESQVELEVSDNGRGFEVPRKWIDLARRGHLGVIGMIERAEAVGGSLTITSQPNAGTRVLVTAPLPPAAG